jgi:Flp pilus assembly protein TadG
VIRRMASVGRAMRATLAARSRALSSERERGSVTAELAIATPLLVLLLMFIVQFGVIWSAQQAAQTAASEAVNAARAQGADPGLGQSQGQATLQQVAGGELPDGVVSVTYSGGQATVVVTGHPQSLVPGWHPQVTAQISAPIETLTQ